MTGTELTEKLEDMIYGSPADLNEPLTAPQLHKINDEIAALMIREIQLAPCEHPAEQRYKVGVFPKIGERCGVCGRDCEGETK